MGRIKGVVKTGGRKKGTPNKTSAELKNWILWFLGEGTGQIEKFWHDPRIKRDAKIELFTAIGPKLISYVLAKQNDTKISFDEDTMKAIKEAQEKVNDLFKQKES